MVAFGFGTKAKTSDVNSVKVDVGLSNNGPINGEVKTNPVTIVEPISSNNVANVGASTSPLANDIGLNNTNNFNSQPANDDLDELDIQKELEAKFDELFGPVDS